jgi:eukaryotic-like serine/threonine-protein kinase
MKKGSAATVCIISLFLLVLIPFANADWSMFHSDASHSGIGTGNPTLNPTLLWKYTVPSWTGHSFTGEYAIYSSPAVVGGTLYVGSLDDNVYALNATNGDKLWNYTTGGEVNSSPAVINGVLYVGSNDFNVYALNAANGAKLWNYTTSGVVSFSPSVVNGVVYIGSLDGNIYALNATNGDKLWSYTTGSYVSSPAFANGVVYAGSGNNIYALNAATGDKIWNYTTGGSVLDPAVVGGVVYISSAALKSNNVYAFNATDGNELWTYHISNYQNWGISSPAVANGAVYVASSGSNASFDAINNVYALNAGNGDQLWNYTNEWPGTIIWSSPAIAGGAVYVSCNGNPGLLYALNVTNGIQLWQYQPVFNYENNNASDTFASSPVVVNGVVYIGSNDATIYAIGGTPASNSSPSPILTPTASSSPPVPEYPYQMIVIMLVVFIITILSAVIISKKRNKRFPLLSAVDLFSFKA